jgi:hypothetical protein
MAFYLLNAALVICNSIVSPYMQYIVNGICSSERNFEVSVVENLVIFRTSGLWNVNVTHLYSSLVILSQQM